MKTPSKQDVVAYLNEVLPDDSANTVTIERDGLPDVAIIRADVLEMFKASHERLKELEAKNAPQETRTVFDILEDGDDT